MSKLLKYLKNSVGALIFVTILLVIQAYTTLEIPSYTSDMVNYGVLGGGFENTVPDVIRKSQLETLTLFLTQEQTDIVVNHYELIAPTTLTKKSYDKKVDHYPLLETEALYEWDQTSQEELEDILSVPMMLVLALQSEGEQADQIKQILYANLPAKMQNADVDLLTILANIPQEQRNTMLETMQEQTSEIPDMLTSQVATAFIKAEYQAIGMDVDQMKINYILLSGLKMLALAFIGMFVSVIVTLIASRIAGTIGRDLRSNVYRKVLTFSFSEMDQFSTASLITRSTNDIQQIQMLMVMMIRIVIFSPILAIGGIFKVLNTNASMTWILVVGVCVIFLIIGLLLIVAMPKFKIMQKLIDRINLVMREILSGLPVIRAFSTEKHESKRFDVANQDLTKNTLFVSRIMTFMMPTLMLLMNIIGVSIVWVGGNYIDAGTMQVGDMIAFIQYTMQIIMSFLMLTMISFILPRAAVAASRVDEVLTTKLSIADPKQEENFTGKQKGLLEFRNVSFRYPNAQNDVLSNINFVANPGETTAIIGSTGCGKSTLINLIPRFYDVTEGSILLDGVDIRNVKQSSLRDQLGFVPQKGVLFSGTIASNIKYGVPEASDEIMKKAARIAQATEFIDTKTEQYESSIAQGGGNVSGGQKQRLSIARAIAKDPNVYIFDDSFSALDYKTDATLRHTLKQELSNRTLIIVAQRVSTIMDAEQILVLDNGKIVGRGTHKELLKNCDVYQQIASSQLSKEELNYE